MTVETIAGLPDDKKADFTLTTATNAANALSTIVGAGEIGIVIESTVDLKSINIDIVVGRLLDVYREKILKLA